MAADYKLMAESCGGVTMEVGMEQAGDIIERTSALRWGLKLGGTSIEMVLQQGWVNRRNGKVEWRDIPQVGLDVDGNATTQSSDLA